VLKQEGWEKEKKSKCSMFNSQFSSEEAPHPDFRHPLPMDSDEN